jgi:hypothetical protein
LAHRRIFVRYEDEELPGGETVLAKPSNRDGDIRWIRKTTATNL